MRFLPIAVLLMVVAGAAAGSDASPDPSARYRVSGVAANDVLNVRAQPSAAAPIVATLAPDARNIVVTGVRTLEGTQTWWEVLPARGGPGWVNARFLAIDGSEAKTEGEFPLRCGGAEPFWSLEIAGGEARYAAPDENDAALRAGAWIDAAGRPPGYRFVVPLTRAGRSGYVAVARAENFCTDGMSDFDFPFLTIVILPEGRVLEGCCARARERE